MYDAFLWSALVGLAFLLVTRPRHEMHLWIAVSIGLPTFLLATGVSGLIQELSTGGGNVLPYAVGTGIALALDCAILAACGFSPPSPTTRNAVSAMFAGIAIGGLWNTAGDDPLAQVLGASTVGIAVISGLSWAAINHEPTAHATDGSESKSGEKPAARDVLNRLRAAHDGAGALSHARADSGAVSVASDPRDHLSRARPSR
jgi:hypothetical protein